MSLVIVLVATLLCHFGCGRDAYVLVGVNGGTDDVTLLELRASIFGPAASGLTATEVYLGNPREISFFLPDSTLGMTLRVTINAWGPTCLVAVGNADATVENRPRLTLDIELKPVPACQ